MGKIEERETVGNASYTNTGTYNPIPGERVPISQSGGGGGAGGGGGSEKGKEGEAEKTIGSDPYDF